MATEIYIDMKGVEIENYVLNTLELYSIYLTDKYKRTLVPGKIEMYNRELWDSTYTIIKYELDTTFYLKGFPYAGYNLHRLE